MLKRQPSRTRYLIFTLFGDYLFPREGWAWTGSLIRLLELLGVSNQAVRSTLSRMCRQGWLKAQRHGRHSLHALTPKARHLLEEGTHRIFEPRTRHWDGNWCVVVYSLPEKKRDLREALRRRLSYLGFGSLAPGTWVSPHDRHAELESLLDDLKARPYVQCFVGRWVGHLSNAELVARCWNLEHLNRQYRAFLRRWRPKLERMAKQFASRDGVAAHRSFVERFWIIHEYSAFPNRDPNLPVELLPAGWLGDEAARVFQHYREMLTESANAFIDATLKEHRGRGDERSSKS